jgi:hypothetical protein
MKQQSVFIKCTNRGLPGNLIWFKIIKVVLIIMIIMIIIITTKVIMNRMMTIKLINDFV